MELFAGVASLTLAVSLILGDRVKVLPAADIKESQWNILEDDHLVAVTRQTGEVTWLHAAPPCRTFTKARRTDEHGTVPILRDCWHPEGYSQPQVLEANEVAKRTAALAEEAYKRGGYFSIENPKEPTHPSPQ